MRVFKRVVQRRSFTLAAEDLGFPRSTVTNAVKPLEARLEFGASSARRAK
jgi:DNA-binding transcriptional LysR family regulator